VSDTDSFIDEVTEEVRRDRLFKLFQKYGWIAVLLVLVLVGGAAFNEYRKAQILSASENFGDAILKALSAGDDAARATALEAIPASDQQKLVLALVKAGEDAAAGRTDTAIAQFNSIAADPATPEIYRQMADLKLVILQSDTMTPADRLAKLEPLTIPGSPFRLLAGEQMALAEIAAGQKDAALSRLTTLVADQEVTAGLRRRLSQLIVALGGELAPA